MTIQDEDRRLNSVERRLTILTWMIELNLVLSALQFLWKFIHG
jgi:hypothetical protein